MDKHWLTSWPWRRYLERQLKRMLSLRSARFKRKMLIVWDRSSGTDRDLQIFQAPRWSLRSFTWLRKQVHQTSSAKSRITISWIQKWEPNCLLNHSVTNKWLPILVMCPPKLMSMTTVKMTRITVRARWCTNKLKTSLDVVNRLLLTRRCH